MGNYNPLSKVVISLTAGSATTNTIVFKGKGTVGNYSVLGATSLLTNTSASQASDTVDQMWSIPIAGLREIICDLTAISGSVTAQGMVIIQFDGWGDRTNFLQTLDRLGYMWYKYWHNLVEY